MYSIKQMQLGEEYEIEATMWGELIGDRKIIDTRKISLLVINIPSYSQLYMLNEFVIKP